LVLFFKKELLSFFYYPFSKSLAAGCVIARKAFFSEEKKQKTFVSGARG